MPSGLPRLTIRSEERRGRKKEEEKRYLNAVPAFLSAFMALRANSAARQMRKKKGRGGPFKEVKEKKRREEG